MRGSGRCDGQTSVEAALLIPVVLTLVALLAQPACVLYTRSVMASAAEELVRVRATSHVGEDELRAYALRRLAAVPDVPAFHSGGSEAWEIESSSPDDSGRVRVTIAGRVRPLPLLGVLVAAFGELDGGEVVLVAEASREVRANWIGGDYGEWVGIWG